MPTDTGSGEIAMTTQTTSRYGFKFVVAVAMVAALAVAGSIGAGGQQQGAAKIDPSALLTSAEIATLPVLHVEDPM
jgi:hypothetical protein